MKKRISAVLALLGTLMLAGCHNTSASSTPVISIGGYNEENPNGAGVSGSSESNRNEAEASSGSSAVGGTNRPRPVTPNNGNQGEISGTVIVDATGRGMPVFGGGSGETYADALNEIKKSVGSQVNVFSMVVPTQGSFYMPENLSMASEWNCIENINDLLYGMIPVDAYSALAAHAEEDIYARTDHHWTQLGAYYAAEEFVKTALINVPFAPLEDYDRYDIEGYLGTLYIWSEQNTVMGSNPETFTYYIPPNDFATYYMNPEDTEFWRSTMFQVQPVSESYSIFMGGDEKVVHIVTDVTNRRKLLIVKDSYANALVPCLTGSFEEIWTVDMRYLEEMQHFPTSISRIVKEYGITDVLFCLDTFSAVDKNADHLPDIV